MNVGYARVSRQDQNPQMQRTELEAAGCEQIFEERISSRKESRPELQRALQYCRQGDVFVVWKLDRLGRSLKELLGLMGNATTAADGRFTIAYSVPGSDHPALGLIFELSIQEKPLTLIEIARDILPDGTVTGGVTTVKG